MQDGFPLSVSGKQHDEEGVVEQKGKGHLIESELTGQL